MKIIPQGYVTARDAVDRVGRLLFGAGWTGKEGTARQGLVAAEEYALAQVTPGTMAAGSGAGGITFTPDPDPGKRWPYGDPTAEEYQQERASRERWDAATTALLEDLASGARTTISLDRATGRRYPIGAEFWLSRDGGKALSTGRAPPKAHYRPSGDLLIAEPPAASRRTVARGPAAKTRGPKPVKRESVIRAMRAMPPSELDEMKEVAMEATFGASRETCRNARNKVLEDWRQSATIDK